MTPRPARETRSWRLRAWAKGENDPFHDQVYVGDTALDTALAAIEKNPATKRYTVNPT